MKLKINGRIFDKWSNLSVSLLYASVCSTFSFDIYFDPYDQVHRQIMLPGAYNEVTVVSDDGEILITGVLLSPSFKSSPVRSLVNISGYSKTGVLDDCEYAAIFPTLQTNGMTLADIARKVCDAFGLVLNPNGGMPDEANKILTQTDTEHRGYSASDFLAQIAKDTNVVLSHDSGGNLLLTQAKDSKPVYDFVQGEPGVQIELSFDGQKIHNSIVAEAQGGGQASKALTNPYVQQRFSYRDAAINNGRIFNAPSGKLALVNEYSPGFRPRRVQQTSTDETDILDVAQHALAEELRAINVTISMMGWELNGRVVRPGMMITITNPECYLFNKTKFFIDRVDFSGDERQESCVINCVVPEVYNGEMPINIFTANGNNTNFKVENGVILRSQDRRGINL